MKYLGCEQSEDGITIWRENGGCIERKALYDGRNVWEYVSEPCPHSPMELKAFCDIGGFGYLPPVKAHQLAIKSK
jgi:hypothetical protein